MSRIVAVEARHDTPTTAAFDYRDRTLYQSAGAVPPGALRVLRGPLAGRDRVAATLLTENPRLLTAVGHGDGDTMMGFGRETLFEPGIHDAAEVAGRIVHLLACETAQKLGTHLVRQGARAFLGYERVVMLHDEVFEAFMECDTAIDLSLLDGDTVRQAHERAHDLFNRHIDRFKAAGNLLQAAVMTTHRNSLKSPVTDSRLGDASATL